VDTRLYVICRAACWFKLLIVINRPITIVTHTFEYYLYDEAFVSSLLPLSWATGILFRHNIDNKMSLFLLFAFVQKHLGELFLVNVVTSYSKGRGCRIVNFFKICMFLL